MIWALVVYTATCLCSGALAQPIECTTKDQCEIGFYCALDTYTCRKCVNCEELKRSPPFFPTTCIKSKEECGPCLEGLHDWEGSFPPECVLPDSRGGDSTLPHYVWWLVGLAVLVVLVFLLIAYSVLRKKTIPIFKILEFWSARTRTCESPPPYEAHFADVRPTAPEPHDFDTQHNGEASPTESSWPFIKRAPSTRAGAARESAGSQAARVYNNPRYVRTQHLPEANPGEANDAMSDDDRDAFTHDEDTMESTWTPDHGHDDNSQSAGVVASAGGGAAAGAGAYTSALAPAASCARQDTNNNRNANEPRGAGVSSAGVQFITVYNNINIDGVQQQNNVS